MNILNLSQTTDEELTSNIKSNIDVGQSLSELEARHSGIFHQKTSGFMDLLEVRDLKENPTTFFYQVAEKYEPEKAKFSTWLGKMTTWECLKHQKKYQYCSGFSEVEENTLFELPHLGRDDAYSSVLDLIDNPQDRKIVEGRVNGKTLFEIGEEVGLCAERVRQRFNLVIEKYKSRRSFSKLVKERGV